MRAAAGETGTPAGDGRNPRPSRRGVVNGQDNLRRRRRDILREHDVPGGANIALVDLVARFALDHSRHAIVEGIFRADHYADMLTALCADHHGLTCCYYFDVPFEETLRRHAGKPQAARYGAAEMSAWYRERDLLSGGIERVILAGSSLEDTVRRIMRDAGLA